MLEKRNDLAEGVKEILGYGMDVVVPPQQANT